MNTPWFVLGLDLGQAQDYTAVVIVEIAANTTGSRGSPSGRINLVSEDRIYTVRHLERLTLGTPYPHVVAHVRRLVQTPPLAGQTTIVVDRTGVGAPVCDLLDEADLAPISITITGGDTVTSEGRHFRVPKRDLVSTVQVLQQTRRLKVVPSLAEAQTLVQEMQAFQVRINPRTAHDSYGAWREGSHDDLLLATAIAVWYADMRRPWDLGITI